ncbi:MAG: FAD-dependent thymidylate synthase [Candidatus Kaiserbacteria bacterium]|nr:FAD-dependent thymidylate synthase [Candidatus Kaiserbacteria bacterium]
MAEKLIVRDRLLNKIFFKEFEHSSGFRIAAICNRQVDPETYAAIGASLSRNPSPLRARLGELTDLQKKRIIGRYFRDYGHNSVGEMGHLFLSVEDISMLAAMQLISFARFQGQEASTRYIDFSEVRYTLPSQMQEDQGVHDLMHAWFDLYSEVNERLVEHYVTKEGMKEGQARPRAFDIAGAFLPSAAKTSVVIACDIRNLIEHARKLRSYEGEEIQHISRHLLAVIDHLCPNSVRSIDMEESVSNDTDRHAVSFFEGELQRSFEGFRNSDPEPRWTLRPWELRPKLWGKTREEIIRLLRSEEVGRYGQVTCAGRVSFRSLRELMRHRPNVKIWSFAWRERGTSSTPAWRDESETLYPPQFCPWYLLRIPDTHQEGIRERVQQLMATTTAIGIESYVRTVGRKPAGVLLPMGAEVLFELTATLDKWMYLLHLRSGLKVHPEVRNVIRSWGREICDGLGFEPEDLGLKYLETPETDYGRRSKDA